MSCNDCPLIPVKNMRYRLPDGTVFQFCYQYLHNGEVCYVIEQMQQRRFLSREQWLAFSLNATEIY